MIPGLSLPALSSLSTPTSATATQSNNLTGAGSVTFGDTKPNWALYGAIAGLVLITIIKAKKA